MKLKDKRALITGAASGIGKDIALLFVTTPRRFSRRFKRKVMKRPDHQIPFGAGSPADDVLAGLDLPRRTVVITGCNSDIGFETLRALAAYARVIGLARDLKSARNACQRAAGSSTPVVCDLADVALAAIAELGR